ncbi:DNAhel-2 [Spodoptera frugiperda granulovirus]|uniref:DNAhel-2 n=1 Tax=Spodoptera frugiperda granulovirus TaxID=307454 RepID=A0A0C5AUY4_9BBAC|nr:DNAhel-2 [Spodoptera frugiperda granulovirus]AJK91783.1 DNAhel-2 [Spodoptera frugiperda granulovirus]
MKRATSPTTTTTTTKRICRLDVPSTLNEEQQKLFDYVTGLEEFAPIFVSGSAGTGKSALLKALKKFWTEQDKLVWVVSYTNLAARNVEGSTIHKQFGFDFQCQLRNNDRNLGAPNYLILDELSMVPAMMLDGISERLKQSTRLDMPFGGVNTIMFGDLYQLPPISNAQSVQLPPYHAKVWPSLRLYELTTNMRQSESDFIEALNLLRVGNNACLNFFDKQVVTSPISIEDQVKCTSLVATHREADLINAKCYAHVKKTQGDAVPEYLLQLNYKPESRNLHQVVYASSQEGLVFKDGLKYCVGTRVMITHNLKGVGFCNGDIGTVMSVNEKGLTVKREVDGFEDVVSMIELAFETNVYKTVKLVTGLPMCYAWAVTIHKSQGMTLKNLIVHPENIFAKGQAYVALSRVTHCEGLRLVSKIPIQCVMKMNKVEKVYKKQRKLNFTEEEDDNNNEDVEDYESGGDDVYDYDTE